MSEVLSFRASCEPSLRVRIDGALDVLCGALRLGLPLAFAFNGGKDSTVALHLLRAALVLHGGGGGGGGGAAPPLPPIVYFGEGADEFPAVTEFMRSCAAAHGFAVRPLAGFKAGLATLVAEGVRAVVMGTRASDPDGVALDGPFAPTSAGWPPVLRVCPLLRWRYADVWAFLRGANLAYCPLYDAGYTSLGAVGDSLPNPRLRASAAAAAGAGADAAAAGGAFSPAWVLDDGAFERAGRAGSAAPVLPPLRCCGARCCCCCGGAGGGGARRAPGAACACGAACSDRACEA